MENLTGLILAAMGLLEAVGVLPRVRRYFAPERRTLRAELFSKLASDVISLVVLQKGLTPDQAARSQEVIDLLKAQLLRQGVRKENAEAVARRALAGAAVAARPAV
jgi:hypothetical protein